MTGQSGLSASTDFAGLETQAEENQVNALVYTMGEEAEDILTSLHLTPEEASVYETEKQVRGSLHSSQERDF